MDKETFKELLRRNGYSVDSSAKNPTILMVGASKDELKKKFMEVKLFAQKHGYDHSIGVKNLEEIHG